MPLPRPRSTFARAVVPVVAGLVVIIAVFAGTWGMAVLISGGDTETSERLAPGSIPLGSVERRAADIAENGPLLFPGLNTTAGERSLVLDHEGDDPTRGWVIYYAFPADRDQTCPVTQVQGTDRFVDCDDRELGVSDLAPPDTGVRPIVEDRQRLVLDLRGVTTS